VAEALKPMGFREQRDVRSLHDPQIKLKTKKKKVKILVFR
jgi:hypothetical protein